MDHAGGNNKPEQESKSKSPDQTSTRARLHAGGIRQQKLNPKIPPSRRLAGSERVTTSGASCASYYSCEDANN
jgi:hypothetical protein